MSEDQPANVNLVEQKTETVTTARGSTSTETKDIKVISEDRVQKWWRPGLGWVAVLAFLYATVFMHLLNFVLTILNALYDKHMKMMETPDLGLMVEVLAMVLGLAYFRTDEKKAHMANGGNLS